MRNRPYGFEIYLVNVKTIRTIAKNFVAFSEKLNFKNILKLTLHFCTFHEQLVVPSQVPEQRFHATE